MSVIVPLVVPFSNTFAPMTDEPVSSSTVPLTVFCAKAIVKEHKNMHSSMRSLGSLPLILHFCSIKVFLGLINIIL